MLAYDSRGIRCVFHNLSFQLFIINLFVDFDSIAQAEDLNFEALIRFRSKNLELVFVLLIDPFFLVTDSRCVYI